jgi:hypothetical protein
MIVVVMENKRKGMMIDLLLQKKRKMKDYHYYGKIETWI